MFKIKTFFTAAVLTAGAMVARSQDIPVTIFTEGGTFTMGSEGRKAFKNEKPPHSVTLNNFSIGKYEVTVAEFRAYCKAAKTSMPRTLDWEWNDKQPIVNVNFSDAVKYCGWLSKTTGKKYRLPTEAEWEYAARGGNKSRGYVYSGSNEGTSAGWSQIVQSGQPQAIGLKRPNELGIYDMSGNVWEWCSDAYDADYYRDSPAANPAGPLGGSRRVLRGGSWSGMTAETRVSARWSSGDQTRTENVGFRVCLSE